MSAELHAELQAQRHALKRALLRLALLLAAVAALLALAGCGGGDWDCPEPPAVADGKKAIPADPCREAEI